MAGGAETRSTTGCHDITAYPAKGARRGGLPGRRPAALDRRPARARGAAAGARPRGRVLALRHLRQRRHAHRVPGRAGRRLHQHVLAGLRRGSRRRRGVAHPARGAREGRHLQAAAHAVRPREVRRALGRPRAGPRPLHHRAGVAGGRRLGRGLHRPGGTRGAHVVRPARLRLLDGLHRRHLGGLPLRRLPLRERHVRGTRGAAAHRSGVRGCRQVRRRRPEPADAALVRVGVARGSGGADRGRGARAARDALGRAGRARARRVGRGHRRAAARVAHARRDRRRVVDADAVGARHGHRRGATARSPPPRSCCPVRSSPGRYDLVVRGDASAPRLALASVVVATASADTGTGCRGRARRRRRRVVAPRRSFRSPSRSRITRRSRGDVAGAGRVPRRAMDARTCRGAAAPASRSRCSSPSARVGLHGLPAAATRRRRSSRRRRPGGTAPAGAGSRRRATRATRKRRRRRDDGGRPRLHRRHGRASRAGGRARRARAGTRRRPRARRPRRPHRRDAGGRGGVDARVARPPQLPRRGSGDGTITPRAWPARSAARPSTARRD